MEGLWMPNIGVPGLIVILVIAQIVYGMLGAFGASRHGLHTNGNIMVNTWLSPKAQVQYQHQACLQILD